MADIITILQSLFAKVEVTEGTELIGAAGDCILATNLTRPTARDFNERMYAQSMGTRQGKIGAISSVGITFDSEIKGNGTTTVPEVHSLMRTVFGTFTTDGFAATNANNGAASTSTSIAYSGGSGSYTKGNALLVETGLATNAYEMVWITSASGSGATGTITVAPALSFGAPVLNARVAATTTYTVQDIGHPSLSIQNYLSGGGGISQMAKYVGCRGNMKFSATKAGDIPMCHWDFKAWSWVLATNGTRPTPTYDTSNPPNVLGSTFKIAGTKTDITTLEIDLGNMVSQKLSQNSTLGVYKNPVTQRKTTGKFAIHPDSTSVSQFTDWTANTLVTLSAQYGNKQFGTVGWYMPAAERTAVGYGDDAGITTNEASFNANITAGQDSYYFAVG